MNGWLTALSVLAILVLTAGTALFVAAEFSLTALERSTVDANARTGDRRDKFVQQAHRTLSFQLSGAQLGISITTLATGYLAEPVVARLLRPLLDALGLPARRGGGVALALALLIATSLSMVYGELVPKNLAVALPVPTARASAGPQILFSTLFTPVIKATNGTANWILRRMGIEPAEELRSARSPQELVSLVRTSARHGALDPVTATLVDRSLRFGERSAEELMTPRSKIEALQADQTVADLVAAATETGFSRFPIVEGDLTRPSASCTSSRSSRYRRQAGAHAAGDPGAAGRGGAVHARRRRRHDPGARQRHADRPGGRRIRRYRRHGHRRGHDRGDRRRRPRRARRRHPRRRTGRPRLVRLGPAAHRRGGRRHRFPRPEGDYETIGGLVLDELGHIPENGESVELHAFDPDGGYEDPVRWLATVVAMDGRRIDQLALTEIGRRADESTDGRAH